MLHKILYSCEEATKLTVKKGETKLTFSQRLRLKMHLLICDACRRFDIQNTWIDSQLSKMSGGQEVCLDNVKKHQIKQSLEAEIKKHLRL